MPSPASPTSPTNGPINFLSDETNARNRLLDDIRIGATLKKSMTTEKSLIRTHGRVIDSPNNGEERISRTASQSPEPKTNGNGQHFQGENNTTQLNAVSHNVEAQTISMLSHNGNGANTPPTSPTPSMLSTPPKPPTPLTKSTPPTPPTPPSTPAESSENFYTITVVPLKPQLQEITTTNAVKNSNFHALEKSALVREQQQPPPAHNLLLRTNSLPTHNHTRPLASPFSPTKTPRFGFTLGRTTNAQPRPTGEKLMISHGKPNFVIQKKKPLQSLNGNSNMTLKESMPKLKKVTNSVLIQEENHVQPLPPPKPVEVNFVELDRQQRQQLFEVEKKFNDVAISPSSTTSSMSAASMDHPAVAAFGNNGPNFEKKTYVSFAKDLAVTPNKYPDRVKVTRFAESMIDQDTNEEQFQVDGYDLRLVKIDMEGANLDEMKVVKRN